MIIARLTMLMTAGLFALSLMTGTTAAQEAATKDKPLNIAVINLQRINREAKIFDSIRSQIDAYRQEFQAIIQAEEDELRKADRELARQRTILAPEAYDAERQAFEKRIVDFQRRGQKKKQDLDGARTQALVEANNIVRKAVADIADKHNVTLILRSDLVAYYVKAMDMTDVVLKELNAAASTIKVPKPKE